MIERAFEFLFKYKSFVFAKGSVALGASWGSLAVAFVLVAVAVPLLRGYPSVGGKSSPRDRVVLALLRVGVLALILLCVLRPSLVVATAVPQQNFVGLLLDDSRSMRIADVDETPRSDFATRQLEPTPDSLRTRLEERFKLRLFRFSDSAGRLDQVEDLRYAGSRTDLGNALDRTRQELASLPLSGLVVITDGADNASDGLEETLSSLRDSGVPVFTIGVGAEEFDRDIEISRIETPGEVLEGSAVGADVVIRQRGFDGETVELFVEDGGRILSSQTVRLPRSGESTVVRATFLAQEPGARLVTFRIAVQDSEMVRENNEQEALVRVRGEVERILYFEGEPRHEVAFIRRALQDDQNLAVVKLVNTAENKFWREIVDPEERYGGEEELYSGFPRTREELYAYAGLILGSVGADQFTPDQQRMIADFVSQRGGGLLTLGGRNSFARGGWAGTPVEEVLPVVLATRVPEPDEYLEVKITPTLFGRSHPVVQLEESAEASQARWQELPPLVTVNPMTQTRPGAVTLLEGRSDGASAAQVILAYQRYGAGRSIAFNVVDSWQWQMHYDIPLEDMTHETLWQQLLRWLVSDVDGQVQAQLSRDTFAPGELVEVVADVFDDTFLAVNNASVSAIVAPPSGMEREVPMEWSVEVDGRYRASFRSLEDGFHTVRVTASRGEEDFGSDEVIGRATELTSEFFGAEMNRDLLERVADETGGLFYTPDRTSELIQDIRFTEGGTAVTQVLDLWDMPIVFLLLVGLIGAEWSYRKIRRLA